MKYTNLNGRTQVARLKDLLRWWSGLHPEKQGRHPGIGVPIPIMTNDGSALRGAHRDAITWIGHASFLVQLGGQSVLIDPVLSPHLGGMVRRNAPPGLDWSALPTIDAVLITHNHRDHLDLPTLKRLGRAPLYLVPHGVATLLRKAGFDNVQEMEWWQETRLGGVDITFVPAEHWSRRGLTDANRSWWGGFVLSARGQRVYHAGDTAWFEGFADIGERCGPLDVALLPIGAYAPRWFMRHQHMDPADALRAFLALKAKRFVAMHWGTFKLTDEDLREPPALLRQLWAEAALPQEPLVIPAIGETLWLS